MGVVSLRGALVGLTVLAGSIHLLVAGQRTAVWSAEAAALAGLGVVQLALAAWLLVRVDSRALLALSATGSLAAAAWLLTRVAGYPVGPLAADVVDPLTGAASAWTPTIVWVDLVVVVSQLVVAALAGADLLADGRLIGHRGLRVEDVAPALIALAAVPGLAAGSWMETYAVGPASPTHTHGSQSVASTLTPAERAALGPQLEDARSLALSIPTLGEAGRHGLVPLGDPAIGVGVQAFDPSVTADDPVDLARPRAWIYASDADDAPVVGLLYDVAGADAPEGFAGADDPWHVHPGECTVPVPSGDTAAVIAMAIDTPVTGSSCELVGGQLGLRVHQMLRVWVVPGWENPAGTFAHDHPSLPAS